MMKLSTVIPCLKKIQRMHELRDTVLLISAFLHRKSANFVISWFKFNNSGLALGTNLKFYTSVAKGLELKVTKFCGLISTFVGVTVETLVGGLFGLPS